MKITLIDGSPRKNGLISQIMSIMQQEAEELGAEASIIKVSSLQLTPCKGCMICRKSKRCVLPEDGAQQVLKEIQQSDALVVGSPCNWGNMNGYLKVMFDRMVYGLMDENKYGMPLPLHKGKKCIIVSTCTTPWPFNILLRQSQGTVRALKEILKYSGFSIVSTFQKGNTRQHQQLTAAEVRTLKKRIRKLIPHN